MEASVTEQIARMASMRTASESAEEMIRDLTVEYNRTRQGRITTELAEIIGGRAAMQ
jgi:F-type H+-transporting ATPase subunit gamma